MEENRKYKIKGVELEIDMDDADFQKKFHDSIKKMEEDEKEVSKHSSAHEVTIAYCDMYDNFFDRIFGNGTSDKMFGKKKNSRFREEAYDQFLGIANKQVIQTSERRKQMAAKFGKYRPKK